MYATVMMLVAAALAPACTATRSEVVALRDVSGSERGVDATAGLLAKFREAGSEVDSALHAFVSYGGERREAQVAHCKSIDFDDDIQDGIATVFECDGRHYVVDLDGGRVIVKAQGRIDPIVSFLLPAHVVRVNGLPVRPQQAPVEASAPSDLKGFLYPRD